MVRDMSVNRGGFVAALVLTMASPVVARDQSNKAAMEKLRAAINQDYSYRDRLNIDWSKRFQEFESKFLAASDRQAFIQTTVELLEAAKDPHIWIKDGPKIVGTHKVNLRPNFNPRLLPKLLPEWKQIGKLGIVGGWPDGVRYVVIGTWDDRDPASMKTLIAAVKEAAEKKAPLILDVRPNTGGNEMNARAVASLFVDKPTVYGKHITRSKGKDSAVQERVLHPDKSGLRHPGPCVVLMGPANMSSCESFLLMMRAAGCRLVGSKSAGSSGNPKPHDLGNGVVVMLPSWRDMSLEGRGLEGVGVTPDVVVDAKPDQFAQADPVLAAALEQVRSSSRQ
jgi:hypothetical protein